MTAYAVVRPDGEVVAYRSSRHAAETAARHLTAVLGPDQGDRPYTVHAVDLTAEEAA